MQDNLELLLANALVDLPAATQSKGTESTPLPNTEGFPLQFNDGVNDQHIPFQDCSTGLFDDSVFWPHDIVLDWQSLAKIPPAASASHALQ